MARLSARDNNAPIHHDKPIGNPECDYQTIASYDEDFEPFYVIHTYPTLLEARTNYAADMNEWKRDIQHEGHHHFGIREVKKEQSN